MAIKIKSILIKLLAGAMNGVTHAMSSFVSVFGPDGRLGKLASGFFRFTLFPFYKLFYFTKYKTLNYYSPAKSKVFYFLNQGYFIHILIVFISCFVVVDNIRAQELRQENFGESTVIYAIISKEEYEELREETQVYSAPIVDSRAGIDNDSFFAGDQVFADSSPGLMTDIATFGDSGAAIVRPNVINPIGVADLPSVQRQNRTGIIEYAVQEGESVYAIALKFGLNIETILWQNGLTSRSIIRPGKVLEILPTNGIVYKVKKNDTVLRIASLYKVDKEKIISENNLVDDNDIKIGQMLVIPGGKMISEYVPPRTKLAGSTQVAPITKLFIPPEGNVNVTGLLWPTSVRRISQYYSWRHTGLDVAGPIGTPLYAADSGVVEYAGWSTGYGNNVLVNHGNGMKTRYAHASKLYVEKGDAVEKGQTLAAMGSTGWSTGSHIHFEIIVNGGKKNPLSYIK